ncbi:MAG TPA: hypothetical protein VES42_14315 [Pilimelia sp.]|nr:hypothetical protein [Pilimelia sp.]
MSNTLTEQSLRPTNASVQQATMEALKDRIEPAEVQKFLDQIVSAGVPSPLGATASANIAVWGKVECDPDGQPWTYDATIWGGPAYFGTSVGFMYTAYESWDDFFRSVTGVHVQGIASGGGILQINWFNESGTPVGQFNGAAGAIGALEAGGSGGWQRK